MPRYILQEDFFHSDDGRLYKAGEVLELNPSDKNEAAMIKNTNLFKEIKGKAAHDEDAPDPVELPKKPAEKKGKGATSALLD